MVSRRKLSIKLSKFANQISEKSINHKEFDQLILSGLSLEIEKICSEKIPSMDLIRNFRKLGLIKTLWFSVYLVLNRPYWVVIPLLARFSKSSISRMDKGSNFRGGSDSSGEEVSNKLDCSSVFEPYRSVQIVD